jgi:hypothetical protein
MRKRVLLVVVYAFATVFGVVASADAQGVPTCQGVPATQWLTVPGTLNFTPGNDVFVGSSGNDDFLASWQSNGGVDIVCAGGGNDLIEGLESAPGSVFYGEGGADVIHATAGTTGKGGAGADWVGAYGSGAVVYGEGGPDNLRAFDGAVAYGGTGNDTGEAVSFGEVYGEQDHDVLLAHGDGFAHGGPGNDIIDFYTYGAVAQGGPGDDTFNVVNFTAGYTYKIACGLNADTVFLNGFSGISVAGDCENVNP